MQNPESIQKGIPDEILIYDMSEYYKSPFFTTVEVLIYKLEDRTTLYFEKNGISMLNMIVSETEINKEVIEKYLYF